MPDDRDADVGPASDREDLFGDAPDADPERSDAHDASGPARGTGPDERDSGDDPSIIGGAGELPDAPRFRSSAGDPPSGDGRPWTADDSPSDASDTSGDGGAAADEPRGKRARASSRGSSSSFLRELPVLLLVAFLLAFLLRTFVLQVFFIPSGSMEPTLQIDDRMVVEKITYLFREPVRGEIVVFEGESFGEVDPTVTAGERIVRGLGQFLGVVPASARDYVKRVIGIGGDEILIEDGRVFVNGQALDEPYVVFEDPSDFGPVTVPEDHLFFLGDNRPNSSDSRRGLGFVPEDSVVGRSAVTIWPFDNVGLLTGVEHELDGSSGTGDETAEPPGDRDEAA